MVRLTMPKLGLTMTEGTVSAWLVPDGQTVSKGQPVFEVETDKILTEATAEADGTLRILAQAGAIVPVLGVLGYILGPGEEPPPLEDAAPPPEAGPRPTAPPPEPPSEGHTLASPAAKRRARELGVRIDQVPAGPNGRVGVADVEASAARARLIPISGVRQVIAERMLASARQTAPVTLTSEVDASELVALRVRLKQAPDGSRVSYDDLLVKLVARALVEFPQINARQEAEAVRLVPEPSIGVAVDTPRGLLVPVVREVQKKTLQEVSVELREKVERAVAGKSLPDDLGGGTFTITNLGALGVDAFTPIINLPEVAILGVGRIQQKPVAWHGSIELRHRVVLSLTFDHRLVDGAPVARFLQRIGELIEAPAI